jgi:mannosyltransferase
MVSTSGGGAPGTVRAVSVLDPTNAPARRSPDATASVDPATTSPRWLPPVALAVAVVGVIARFAASTPLWLDEALSVNIAALPLGDIAEALRHDGHPPLYYFLLHGWMDVVGDGDTAVRALSGLISVLTLPLIWIVARRRAGDTVAWLALLILAVSPYALRYGTETRMYSLVIALTLLGWWAIDLALESPRPLRLAAVTICSGALLLTHYWSFWLLGAVGLLLLFRTWKSDGSERTAAGRTAMALAAGGVFFLPWLPSFLEQASSTGTPWADPSRPTAVVANTVLDFGGGQELVEAVLYAVLLGLLVALGLLGRTVDKNRIELDLRTQPEHRPAGAVVALTVVIGSLMGYATASAYAGRYASVFVAPVIVLMAVGASRLIRPMALAVVVVLVLILSAGGAYEVLFTDRTQADQLAAPINAEASPGDLVVFCPDQLGPAGLRAITVDVEAVNYPDFGDPAFVDWVDYEDRNRASDPAAFATEALDRAGNGTIWLISSGDYRTFEGKCSALQTELRRARPTGGLVVGEDGAAFFEHGALQRFNAP